MSNPFNKAPESPIVDPAEELLAKAAPSVVHQAPPVETAGTVSDKSEVEPTEETLVKEKTYAKEEILPILDQILNNGYAMDTFKIRNTDIVMRTRFTWEEKAIYEHLEATDTKTVLRYQREFAFITMAASLVKFGNNVFKPINEGTDEELKASITERYKFIISLNSILTDVIQKKLADFDDKQRYIIKHFDELLKDF